MPTSHTLTGDLSDVVGTGFPRDSVWVTIKTNLGDNPVFDTAGEQIRFPRHRFALPRNAQFSKSLWSTAALTNPTGYQYGVEVEWPDGAGGTGKKRWFSGWFSLTADKDMSELDYGPMVPPEYYPELTVARDEAVAAKTDAEAAQAAAEAAQAAAEAVGNTNDTIMAGVASDSGSAFSSVLLASYERVFTPEAFGAAHDGATDDTAAIQAALDAAATIGVAGTVYLLPGAQPYRVTAALSVADGVTLAGAGHNSRIRSEFAGYLFTLTGRRNIRMINFRVSIAHASGGWLTLSNTFRCHFMSIFAEGQHGPSTGATYHAQVGVLLTGNAGDNRFVSCDINNFGTGVRVDSIMNYFIGCDFGTNYRGIHGGDPTGVVFGAGVSLTNCTMVSTAASTDRHVWIEGSANSWWFHGLWIEGAVTGMEIGNGSGGPVNVVFSGGKVAATTTCLKVANGKEVDIIGVRLSADPSASPTDVSITGGQGKLIGVNTDTRYQIVGTDLPANWVLLGREMVKLLTNSGALRSHRAGTTSQYVEVDGGDAGGAYVTAVGKDLFLRAPNVGIGRQGALPTFGGGSGVVAIRNAETVPTSSATGGGILFVESGALKYRGSSGTVTTIAPA